MFLHISSEYVCIYFFIKIKFYSESQYVCVCGGVLSCICAYICEVQRSTSAVTSQVLFTLVFETGFLTLLELAKWGSWLASKSLTVSTFQALRSQICTPHLASQLLVFLIYLTKFFYMGSGDQAPGNLKSFELTRQVST